MATALEAGKATLVPIVIGNAAHVFNMRKKRYSPGVINVKILGGVNVEVRDGEGQEDAIVRVTEDVREAMLGALEEISSPLVVKT